MAEHQLDRLVVEIDPVVDRADPGPDRVLDPVGALGVGHDEDPGGRRLLDERGQLGRPEVSVPGVVARRQDAARGRDLDDVGPQPDQLADDLADLVGTVDERRRAARMGLEERDLGARGEAVVAVPAGLGQHADRDLEPWPGDQAVGQGPLDPEVGAAGVADGRDPGLERRAEVAGGLEELVRERLLGPFPGVDVADADMDVAVEQARQDRPPGDVDLIVAVEPGPDVDDPAVLDRDIGRGRRRAGAIDDLATPEDHPAHRSSSRPAAGSPPASIVARKTSVPPGPVRR